MKHRNAIIGTACIALLAFAQPALASAEEFPTPTGLTASEGKDVQEYLENHPLDYEGLEKLIVKSGGAPLSLSMNGIEGKVSGQQASEISRSREAAYDHQLSRSAVNGISPMAAIPLDAFDTTAAFVPIGVNTWVAHGTWNFRDNFVGTGDPDDIAALHLSEMCLEPGEVRHEAFRYDGTETATTYLKDAGLSTNSPIVGVRDSTSGHASNTDHGYVQADLRARCGPTDWQTQFTFEHNQGGGSVLNVSAAFGLLSVSYNGSPMTLQKSSQIATKVW